LEEERFEVLHGWLKERGVTQDDLGEACRVFIELMQTANVSPTESVHAALMRVGWFEVRDEARIAYIFYIGAQLMGVMFTGLREAVGEGDSTLEDIRRLSGLADQVQRALAKPKWRRTLSRWRSKCQKWLIRLLQGSG
jgi:hypothetical protein